MIFIARDLMTLLTKVLEAAAAADRGPLAPAVGRMDDEFGELYMSPVRLPLIAEGVFCKVCC